MSRFLVTALLLTLALAGPAPATRVINQPEDAYELSLGEVSLPQRVGGSLTFKLCPVCNTIGLRVTANTRYFLSAEEVPVEDLAALAAQLDRSTSITVFYDKESGFVNRLKIN